MTKRMTALAEDQQSITRPCPDQSPVPPETILRFVTTERLLHWAIAVPFLGCFISAVVLVVVYNPDPTRAYRPIFAWMHRGCAAGLILCPSLVLLASVRRLRIHFYNIRQAWVWRFDDIKWLAMMGPAALSRRVVLPDQGKFNAAEKLNFMMVMIFCPLFIASGLLIWFPEITRLDALGPWIIHCGLAALATPLVVGHMIMATINPSTRVGLKGMITGFVSREWAAHHYARWFREQFPDLAAIHAGGKTRDTAQTPEVDADPEGWPHPAAEWLPLPAEPAPAAIPVLAGVSLGAAIAHVSTFSHSAGLAPSGASFTAEPGHVQPTGDAWAAAVREATGTERAAGGQLDCVYPTDVRASIVPGTATGGYEPPAVDDPGEVTAQIGNDGRAVGDRESGIDRLID